MKQKRIKRPPNMAARALGEQKFKQRVVKAKESYSRKDKHKKREDHDDGLSSFSLPAPNLAA